MRKKGGFLLGLALLCGLALTLGGVAVLGPGQHAGHQLVGHQRRGGPSSGGSVALNDTLGQPVIGPSSSGDVGLNAGYWYARPNAELHCGLATGSYDLGPEPEVNVTVQTLGTLACLRVERVDADHPNRTGSAGGSGMGWGGYWVITATNSTGAPAAGYVLTLTLPHSGLSDPQVCKWKGTGWDCARDGFNTDAVWRGNIISLSDWAVGEHVGPTAVKVKTFEVKSGPTSLWQLVLLVGLLGAAILGFAFFRRSRQNRHIL